MKSLSMKVAMMAIFIGLACGPSGALSQSPVDAILVAFHSPQCGPCRSMTPVLKGLSRQGIAVRYVDVTREQSMARRHAITQTPTYIVMAGGKETTRLVGIQSADRILRSLQDQPDARLRQTSSVTDQQPRTRLAVAPTNWGGMNVRNDVQSQGDPPASSGGINRSFNVPDRRGEAMPSLDVADAVERARAATVRLRIFDAAGYSAGTGTIIDTHGEEALVLTCGHLFRETGDQGRIEVDIFVGGQSRTVTGSLIDFDAKNRDIAVVAIQPGISVAPVSLAVASAVAVGTPAFSFGCDRGKDPSRRETRITGVDKYNQHLGASNYEIEGAPIDGRSGGGLFDQRGQLIGVCNAADYDDDTGIYAGPGEVRWQLERIDMVSLYQNVRPTDRRVTPATTLARPTKIADDASSPRTGRGKEMIVIIRDPVTGRDEVMTIANPSNDLMASVRDNRRRF